MVVALMEFDLMHTPMERHIYYMRYIGNIRI